MSRNVAIIALALLLLAGLGACGRKGPLEAPQSAVITPGAPVSS